MEWGFGDARTRRLYWALWRTLGWAARQVRLVIDPHLVMVEGVVPTKLQAQLVERALGEAGASAVCNRLAIAGAGTLAHGPRHAGGLAFHLTTRLSLEPLLDARGITVTEEGPGIVVLCGAVTTRYHRDIAESIARRHPGVRAVRTELLVVPPSRQEPASVALNEGTGNRA